jgi:hypothetical protein
VPRTYNGHLASFEEIRMPTIIRISDEQGKPLFVNADSILYIQPWPPEKGCHIYFGLGHRINTTESAESIAEKAGWKPRRMSAQVLKHNP